MRWLTGRLGTAAARPHRDRGGTTVILSALLGAGVLIGAGAIVIDVGQLYIERSELQSGADAAAVAVARDCASGGCGDAVAVAREYADRNAEDGLADVAVCGHGVAGLPECPAPGEKLTDCIGDPPGTSYVEVRTTTLTEGNSTVLPPTLARGLSGDDGYEGTTVGACARASIEPGQTGTVTQGDMINLTVNLCYWQMYTGSGGNYSTADQILYIKDSQYSRNGNGWNDATYCPDNLGSQNAPGNWGWLDDDGTPGDCQGTTAVNDTVGGDPGNNTPAGCAELLQSLRASGAPLMLPLFDRASGNGSHATYHIAAIGAFVVTGFKLTGNPHQNSAPSSQTGRSYCSGSERCIYGYFTDVYFTDGVLQSQEGAGHGASVNQPPVVELVG